MTDYDFITTELDALSEVFGDWTWGKKSLEPDGRITVLLDPGTKGVRFLCRVEDEWAWASNREDWERAETRFSAMSWNRVIGMQVAPLRLPVQGELRDGGWTIETVYPEPEQDAFDRTVTTTELDALEDEFDHRVWRAESEEPDARVTVLYDEADRGATRWLVRVGTGWAWASPYGDPAAADPWDAIQRWMDRSGRALRIPDRKELADGGWTIVGQETEERVPDEAAAQLDAGFRALDMMDLHGTGAPARRASAHFMASIAISLHTLVALHQKYDPENMEVVVDPGPAKDSVTELQKQLDNLPDGPGGESFPWAR